MKAALAAEALEVFAGFGDGASIIVNDARVAVPSRKGTPAAERERRHGQDQG